MSENSKEFSNQKTESQEPTEEEIKARKEKLLEFYAEEIPFLQKQAEYEQLITNIEVAKMTRIEIMMHRAQMMMSQEEKEEKPSRKLKVEK